jgi:hypothetical protein
VCSTWALAQGRQHGADDRWGKSVLGAAEYISLYPHLVAHFTDSVRELVDVNVGVGSTIMPKVDFALCRQPWPLDLCHRLDQSNIQNTKEGTSRGERDAETLGRGFSRSSQGVREMTHDGEAGGEDGRRNRLVRLAACAGALVFAVAVATTAMHHQVGFFSSAGGGEGEAVGVRERERERGRGGGDGCTASYSPAFVG